MLWILTVLWIWIKWMWIRSQIFSNSGSRPRFFMVKIWKWSNILIQKCYVLHIGIPSPNILALQNKKSTTLNFAHITVLFKVQSRTREDPESATLNKMIFQQHAILKTLPPHTKKIVVMMRSANEYWWAQDCFPDRADVISNLNFFILGHSFP